MFRFVSALPSVALPFGGALLQEHPTSAAFGFSSPLSAHTIHLSPRTKCQFLPEAFQIAPCCLN